jgi:hypothetical protein
VTRNPWAARTTTATAAAVVVVAALVATLLTAAPVSSGAPPVPCEAGGFTDVSASHPFYADICWMADEGISTGYEPGPTYRPSATVTRQAMSAFLYRLAGSPELATPTEATFADVGLTHHLFAEVEWMAAEGISTGYEGSPKPTYRPSAAVTRGAMSAFLYRIAGSPDFTDPAEATFADVGTGHAFSSEVEWMAAEQISTGYEASPKPSYRPGEPVTRQAMSAFLHRLADGPGVGIDPPPPPAESDAFANRNWVNTAYDTCPVSLHETFSVIGPDGKLYPTWHPPTVTDPATGQPCTFGHEHGADPELSDIHGWVVQHMAAEGEEAEAGIPFGYANEALIDYAAANPGTPTRFEDHVGHKVSFANDVVLLDEDGHYVPGTDPATGNPVNVTCDYLMKVHQGSHSADATGNNLHELLYAVQCNDGTEVLATTMAAFGAANEFQRSCAPAQAVAAGTSHPFEDGGGVRLLPDRGCIEQYVLVSPPTPPLQSDIWSLYESWQLEESLTLPSGDPLAWYEPWFAVRNPSRYFQAGQPVGRTVAAAWEPDTGTGTVNAQPWLAAQQQGPYDAYDPRSPFDGAQRDFYVQDTEIQNDGQTTRWYTDPMGGSASTEPFPGAICQIVSNTDNSQQPELKRRLFGRTLDYGAASTGVHAPN